MGLFKPAWASKNWDKAVEAVANLVDKAEIVQAAREAPCYGARRAAVRRISEQGVIADIAKNEKESCVREAAVARLCDQALLDHIRLNDSDQTVRAAAARTLNTLRLEDANRQLCARIDEISKMKDQVQLADIAINDSNSDIRVAAINSLTSQEMLIRIAMEAADQKVFTEALERIENQSIFAKIAGSRRDDFYGCSAAIDYISDQTALVLIAKDDTYYCELRDQAIRKLTDRSALMSIAKSLNEKPLKSWTAPGGFREDCDWIRERAKEQLEQLVCRLGHRWKEIDSFTAQNGDTYTPTYIYRCERCGMEKTELGNSWRD
ncbi:MAG: hypothetical protein FWE41_04865 [Coriobacteriia bacterium]|nr:hypothetical protein [Coriobacteriia bacterium]